MRHSNRPTVVTIPCFSGAPWSVDQLTPLRRWPIRAPRLPEGLDSVEAYADFIGRRALDLERYILVGDSFGALVALALATRRPRGLQALVLSGGFAAAPVGNRLLKLMIRAARLLPGPPYRQLTLRLHARALASPHDRGGQVPWTPESSRALFVEHTPHRSYVARARAALAVDYRDRLGRIEVPTLILTPSYDPLNGAEAARELLEGIPDAREVVLPQTGPLLRFTHPLDYAEAVRQFLRAEVLARRRIPARVAYLAEEARLRAAEHQAGVV